MDDHEPVEAQPDHTGAPDAASSPELGGESGGLSRRSLLMGLGAAAAGTAVASYGAAALGASPKKASTPAPNIALPKATSAIRKPGSLPNPKLKAGTDTMPQIEHIVVLMMENHSYDDHFGMLPRGDGFKLGSDGFPIDANLYTDGNLLKAFHMPSSCQLDSSPGQNWNASHTAYDNGKNDGFVNGSGPVAMGYWDQSDIPFYYGLGMTFPVCDRWFCSVLAQTYPNRRFLMAGTAAGIISTTVSALTAPAPPNGTIFDRLDQHKISWKNYYTDLPSADIIKGVSKKPKTHFVKTTQFLTDAATGKLPAFSLVDPNYSHMSEEDPQDIRRGEAFCSQIINAVMHGKNWAKTLLIWTYDEHGGYYDHVPPPKAIKPDNIAPEITVPPDLPGAYDRYGFRVPAVIVSPYARKNYVSHVVHDHTSILKLIETKWNLPALTFRDANADNLLDSLNFKAKPAFLTPPTLPAPGLASPQIPWSKDVEAAQEAAATAADSCSEGAPGGTIPPPEAIVPASQRGSLRVGAS